MKSLSVISILLYGLLSAFHPGHGWAQSAPAVLPTASPEESVTVEWIYKKSHEYEQNLPRNILWSPRAPLLAYLVSDASRAPALVFYDPIQDATRLLITPAALTDAVSRLKEKPTGVSLAADPQLSAPTSTEGTSISRFEWLNKGNGVRLYCGERIYEWDLAFQNLVERNPPKGEKTDLSFSPDGRFVAYTRAFDLYAYDFAQRREIRLTEGGSEARRNGRLDWVYPEELEISRGFEWSPRSDRIAYLQLNEEGVSRYPVIDFTNPVPAMREQWYPKTGTKNPSVRVGVVSLSTAVTQWIDLSYPYEYIARMVWEPQGNHLAVQALNRAQNRLALLLADVVLGTSRILLEEQDPYWVNVNDGPFFYGEQGDFLWLSERDGYRHLFQYSQKGRRIKPLTSGAWEVTRFLRVDKKSKYAFCEAAFPTPLERQILRVSLADSKMQPLTHTSGTHQAKISPDGEFLSDTFTNVSTPRCLQVLDRQGLIIFTLGEIPESAYPFSHLRHPEFLTLKGPENRSYHAKITTPLPFNPNRKYPVIVSVYGGPHGQVVSNHFPDWFEQVLTAHGFVVFSLDNRGSSGRGHAWESPIHQRFGEKELEDLLLGVEYLKTLPYVDPQRLGMWGWSFGGYFTCYAMLKAPGLFRCGAAVAPVTDWRLYDTIYTERYMGLPEDNPEGYHDSSPVFFADRLQGSLFLAHGVSDDNVHIQNTYRLVDALEKAGKTYELFVYPERDHGIGGEAQRIHLFTRILQFFEKELNGKLFGSRE